MHGDSSPISLNPYTNKVGRFYAVFGEIFEIISVVFVLLDYIVMSDLLAFLASLSHESVEAGYFV
jgi:hypothetical protein